MRYFLKNPPVLSSSIAAVLSLALLGAQAQAQSTGTFSNSGPLGSADQSANVGLNATKTYLQAVDLGDAANTSVNGVLFTGATTAVAPSGTGWALTGTTALYGGGGTLPAGPLGSLTNAFVHAGRPAVLTLTGLAVGQTYVITFYNRSWEAAGARVQDFTASGASTASTSFDLDIGATGQGNLNLLRYTFQAASGTQSLSIAPQNTVNPMHLYAFSTEQTFNNTLTGGTTWSSAAWSTGQPNAAGTNASFTAAASPTTFTLDAARTVGHVQFAGTNAWTLAGASTLTLQTDVGGVSVLSTPEGSHTIATPVVLASDTVKFGAGTLTLSGAVSGAKGLSVNGGTLELATANSYSGGTIVNAGATLRQGVAGALGAATGALAVNSGGLLNVNGLATSVGNLTGSGTIANDAPGTNAVLTVGTGLATGGTFGGVLADHTTGTGTLALTKIGASTLTLSGANSFTGPTTISEGRLQLNAAAASGTLSTSGINIGANATLGFSAGAGTTLSLKAGSTLTLGGGTIVFDVGAANASDKIETTNFVLTAPSIFAINPISSLDVGATYTLATFSTLTSNGFGIAGTTAGRLTMNPELRATSIVVTPTLDSGTWNKTSGGPWSAGPWTNYTPAAAGDSAVFGTALDASGTVTLDGPRAVGYLTFAHPTASYTLGTAGSSNLLLDNGTSRGIVAVTAGSHFIAENIALASDVSFSTNGTSALTVSGILNGTKTLTKFGSGTLTLSNANTFSGGTTISEGTLRLGDGTLNGSVVGPILNNATLAFENGSAQTMANVISGTGAVTKSGAAALTLTAANTFSGGLTINAGLVDVGGNTATGSISGPVLNNGTLRFSRTGVTTIDSVITGSGNTIIAGGVSQTLSATASINTPTLTVGDSSQGYLYFGAPNQLNGTTGVLLNIGAHAGNSRINLNGFSQTISGLTGTGIIQSAEAGTVPAATLTINVPGTNSYSWTGLIRNQAASGPLALTKTGTGEQIMNFSITNPTYSGATTISQGRLVFGSTLAAPAWNTSGIIVDAGAEVGLTGAGAGVVSWAEGVVISGAGDLVRTGADFNVVTINNATNSFTGATRLTGTGTLSVGSLANAGANSAIGRGNNITALANAGSLVFDGGTLRYTGAAVNSDRLFTLTPNGGTLESSGSGALNLTNPGTPANSGTGARTLILSGNNTANNTLAAALGDGTGGATSLSKTGAGTWVLTGANTFSGTTTISEGRLQLDGSAAASPLATANLALDAAGTLGFTAGTGSTLTLANALTLNGGTVVLDLGTVAGSDKIAAQTLSFTANTTLNFNQISGYEFGSTYTLATYNTLNANGFTVSGVSAGRLALNPVVGPNAITMIPVLDSTVWNSTAGGVWGTGPWTSYTPDAVGDAALFGTKLNASGAVTLAVPRTVGYVSFDNALASYTLGAVGSANLTLATTGTASAQLTVNAGTHSIAEEVSLASDLVVSTNPGTGLVLNGGVFGPDKSVTKTGAGTLTLNGTNNFGSSLGTRFNINQGSVVLGSTGALVGSPAVAVNGGTLDLNGNDTAIGILSGTGGTVTDRSITPGTTIFTLNHADPSIFAGVLADGPARSLAVVKGGTGLLTLAGANTFTGGLTISGGSVIASSGAGPAVRGQVTLGNGSAIPVWLISGAASQQFGAETVLTFANAGTDAKFELRGSNQTLAGVDSALSNNLSIIQNDELTAPGYTVAPGAAVLTLNTATDHSFHGIIRNQIGGALGITKEGIGTQELINQPTIEGITHTGPTTINNGKLLLNFSGATAAAFASDITVNGPGFLGLDGTWTLSRAITGTGTVLKQGFGNVTLAGDKTYTGDTIITGGTLSVTGALSGTANIDVLNGGIFNTTAVVGGFNVGAAQTLKGGGIVQGVLNVSGRLAPGDGQGILNTDTLTLASGSTLALEINTNDVNGLLGASDSVNVNGLLSLASGVLPTLSLTDLGANVKLAQDTTFTILTYSGGWNGGLFAFGGNAVADEGIFSFGANQFRLDYDGAGGTSVLLVAVPEPSAALALLTGLGTLLGLRRRRRV